MADAVTVVLRLNRPELPGGVEVLKLAVNGDVALDQERGEPFPVHSYLWELDDEQRAMRLAQLRERLRGRDNDERTAPAP